VGVEKCDDGLDDGVFDHLDGLVFPEVPSGGGHDHRDAGRSRCGCTLAIAECVTRAELEAHADLTRWENQQVDRLRRGLPHSLPRNHPKVLDKRWIYGLPTYGEPEDLDEASGS
jgi:hypothetical protein